MWSLLPFLAESSQSVNKAKKASMNCPVFIKYRGRTAHVLLSIEEYHRITAQHRNIADALAMPEAAEIEFEVEPVNFSPCTSDFS